jgi:hypothetical protein
MVENLRAGRMRGSGQEDPVMKMSQKDAEKSLNERNGFVES